MKRISFQFFENKQDNFRLSSSMSFIIATAIHRSHFVEIKSEGKAIMLNRFHFLFSVLKTLSLPFIAWYVSEKQNNKINILFLIELGFFVCQFIIYQKMFFTGSVRIISKIKFIVIFSLSFRLKRIVFNLKKIRNGLKNNVQRFTKKGRKKKMKRRI